LFATEGTRREVHNRYARRRSPLWYLAAASSLLVLGLGGFFLTRRATGAFSSLPRVEVVALTALILVACTWLVRLTLQHLQPALHGSLAGELRSLDSVVAVWLPMAAIALFAAACSFPFQRVADCFSWPLALAAVLLGPRLAIPARRGSPAIGEHVGEATVLQELVRYRLADGRESVRGTLRADFATGERIASLYAGFCPPFEQLPRVEAVAISGPPATVKLAQVLHQGTQIEVRLSAVAACQQSVVVRLSALEFPAVDAGRT
jgi:hypothetical protein